MLNKSRGSYDVVYYFTLSQTLQILQIQKRKKKIHIHKDIDKKKVERSLSVSSGYIRAWIKVRNQRKRNKANRIREDIAVTVLHTFLFILFYFIFFYIEYFRCFVASIVVHPLSFTLIFLLFFYHFRTISTIF